MTERERMIDECITAIDAAKTDEPLRRWDGMSAAMAAVSRLRATPAAAPTPPKPAWTRAGGYGITTDLGTAPEPPRWTREQVERLIQEFLSPDGANSSDLVTMLRDYAVLCSHRLQPVAEGATDRLQPIAAPLPEPE
jgi:hypothetical protein